MDFDLTLEAIERFEDASGMGLVALVDGSDIPTIKSRWTVKRMRLFAQCVAPPGTTDADIEDWLKPSNLVSAQMEIILQVMNQLTPPSEVDDYLPRGEESGEDDPHSGNSGSGAG